MRNTLWAIVLPQARESLSRRVLRLLVNDKDPMSVNKTALHAICLVLLGFSCSACFSQSIERHLHKNAFLDQGPSEEYLRHFAHKPISSRQAASFALDHFKARGATDIVICEVTWIAAPLGGYLVDAKAKANIEGATYTVFRVGVRDGTEQEDGKSPAGEMFVFIALGRDSSGRFRWYPAPGPDYSLVQGQVTTQEMLAYEFLLHRDKFQTLDSRY